MIILGISKLRLITLFYLNMSTGLLGKDVPESLAGLNLLFMTNVSAITSAVPSFPEIFF